MKIIGREPQKSVLEHLYNQNKSVFLVVYGRRRVGKTYLVRKYFSDKFAFYFTGMTNVSLQQQLANFGYELNRYAGKSHETPKDWLEAFQLLRQYLEQHTDKRKLVFIDELPWLDTPRSGFLGAFEHFWNAWASAQDDIFLIACGSAASWMIKNLFNNKGGLHNRVTHRMRIEPFNLYEVEQYAKYKNLQLNRFQLLELYMAMGGIPYYLDFLQPGKSARQNINDCCFGTNAPLRDEFDNLYDSLFKHASNHERVIKALAQKKKGLTRNDIIAKTQLPDGGGTTKVLKELVEAGFVQRYTPLYKKKRESLYQLVDFYSLFYFAFLEKQGHNPNYWLKSIDSPAYRAWSGFAFERICLHHISQLKQMLGIAAVQTEESSWLGENAQIDLIIDRRDQVITVCEMKFSSSSYMITKTYAKQLREKVGAFRQQSQSRKAVHLAMITPYGLKQNAYANELVQNDVSMEGFFNQAD